MRQLAKTCEDIAATTKKLQKTAIVADYLKSCSTEEAAVSAVFLCGRPFPVWEETTLQIGGRSLWQIVADLSGKDESALTAVYRRRGDLGAVAEEVLPDRAGQELGVVEVEQRFRQIAGARGPSARAVIARDLLSSVPPLEAKYIVKIMTGDLRIGLKESLVEEAIAKAYGATLAEVQRANMLLGDVGETLKLATAGRLADARMRLFHPLGFMLASPVESAEEGLRYFAEAAVEDKYDGIRAQAHVSEGEVSLFSRTRDDITESFPELPPALAGLPQDAILDGEIVAWEFPAELQNASAIIDQPASQPAEARAKDLGRARPFTVLQQRLGRKKVSERMLRETPVAFLAFDILYCNGELLIDRSLRERARILDTLLSAPRKALHHRGHRGSQGKSFIQDSFAFDDESPEESLLRDASIIRAPVFRAAGADELDLLFNSAQERGNEGLMIKDLDLALYPRQTGQVVAQDEARTGDARCRGHRRRVRARQAHRRAQRLHLRGLGWRQAGEYRQSLLRPHRRRDCRDDEVVSAITHSKIKAFVGWSSRRSFSKSHSTT